MYCQICGTRNHDEAEYCRSCNQRLLVVSGGQDPAEAEGFDEDPEEEFSFDEHLLERISILEEVMKRTAESVRQALGTLYKLEQKILVNQTGVTTLRDLLETKGVLAREEWSELWESRMDYQLLALEKRERFAGVKERIAALHQGEDRRGFRRFLDDAEVALLAFDVDGAVDVLERAHRLDPKNHELAFFLAETFFNEGRMEEALRYFLRVLEVKPGHYESLVYAGVLYNERGEPGRAEELLKHAVALYPDAFLPAFSLGAVHSAAGRLPQAVALLERAVRLESMPHAHYLLGSCYYEMGRLALAIRHLEETIRQDPLFEDAFHRLGLAYLDRRWYRKSLHALGEAQRLDPNRLRYRELVELLGDGAERAVGGAAGELLGQAESALAEGQGRQALTLHRQALQATPDDPVLLVAYAMLCLEVDRTEEIEPVVEKVLSLAPAGRLRASAMATLIEALRTQGRYREGNNVGRRLLAEGGSDFAESLACYEMACNLAEMEEELDEALTLARRALELSPRELRPHPLAALGWVHYKRGELAEAVDRLGEATRLRPSARTYVHLAMALLAAGERDRARQALAAAEGLGSRRRGIEEKVLECLRDGGRLLSETPARRLRPAARR